MINYWVISPYDSSDKYLYQRAWRFCLEHKTISVGHTVPEDLKNKNEEEFFDIICKYYHNLTNAWLTRKNTMLWQFYNEIKPDDLIIARRGLLIISGIGKVKSEAYYEFEKNKYAVSPGIAFHHHIDVDWQKTPRDLKVSSSGFARGAFLQQISYGQYCSLLKTR